MSTMKRYDALSMNLLFFSIGASPTARQWTTTFRPSGTPSSREEATEVDSLTAAPAVDGGGGGVGVGEDVEGGVGEAAVEGVEGKASEEREALRATG